MLKARIRELGESHRWSTSLPFLFFRFRLPGDTYMLTDHGPCRTSGCFGSAITSC